MQEPVFHHLRPILYTDKLVDTLQFYRDVLGFEINNYNADWAWASLARGSIEIMMSKPVGTKSFEKPIFTGSLYINCEGVDALWTELKDKVEVVYALEDFPWGMREFAVYDLNGYVLQFGEMIK